MKYITVFGRGFGLSISVLGVSVLVLSLFFSGKAVSLEGKPGAEQYDTRKDGILPLPGVSPEEIEKRDVLKKDMLEQRTAREEIIVERVFDIDPGVFASDKIISEENVSENDNIIADISGNGLYDGLSDEYEDKTVPDSKGFGLSHVTVLVGPALVVKNTRDAARNVFFFIEGNVAKVKQNSSEKVIKLDPMKIPQEAKAALEQLSEVEGVAVSIPGVEFTLSGQTEERDVSKYEVEGRIFTIDGISLEKTVNGGFISRIPGDAKESFETKTLSFCSGKDSDGKTIASRIEEGCAETLAKVLAKWAKYSSMGFDFSKETEERVIKAVIKFVGIGMEDGFVKLEESEISSGVLEREIAKIIGEDEAAMTKIARFISPEKSPRNKK